MEDWKKRYAWFVIYIIWIYFEASSTAAQIGDVNFIKYENNSIVPKESQEKSLVNYTRNMKIVSYYAIPNNGSDRTLKNLAPEDINPHLCSHIIVAFANIVNSNIQPKRVEDVDIYKKVLALKNVNPDLKVMLSLNGGFQSLVKNKSEVDIFAYNAHQWLVEFGFDGLDLDWEFPAWPLSLRNSVEKEQFSYLVVQLYNALKLSSHPPLLLSLAVAAPKTIVKRSYQIKILAQNVDFINLMGYDFRIFWPYLPFTGHNAPLHRRSMEKGYFGTLNIEWAAKYWIREGTPKQKLVVGIPTYGRTWKLLSFLWNNVGAPAVSEGILGGALSYPQALTFLKEGAIRRFDEKSKVPYSVMGRNWVSYEDRDSIAEKVNWIKNQNLGGVMTWNLNCDDYEGIESGRKFDLHQVINDIVNTK